MDVFMSKDKETRLMERSITEEEARGKQSSQREKAVGPLPPKVSALRHKLGQKARQEPKFRFYTLYDRIYRRDVLMAGWQMVARNRGSAGVDGISIPSIQSEPGGVEALIEELHEELASHRYRPRAIKRVWLPKPDGGKRPLGIPTVRDRVVQAACLLILEPIFEADFEDCSYGFRPGRNQHQALAAIYEGIDQGQSLIYDADLKGYFDAIPHAELLRCLAQRISDRSVLKLIRQWLSSPVEEENARGKKERHSPRSGIPQGGVISPLLSNVYLHWFDRAFTHQNRKQAWYARLVRYADDFVIQFYGKRSAEQCIDWVRQRLGRMGLEVNEVKTRLVQVTQKGEEVCFLGYTFKLARVHRRSPVHRVQLFPSKQAVRRCCEKITRISSTSHSHRPMPEVVKEVSRVMQGWGQYYSIGSCYQSRRIINWHCEQRLYRFAHRKGQRGFKFPRDKGIRQYFRGMGLRTL